MKKRKMKVWMVCEAQKLEGCCCSEAESLNAYALAYTDEDSAMNALRNEFLREVVNAEYEGCDDPEIDIDKIVDEIIKDGQSCNGVRYYDWEATDRTATWKVFESEVK